MSEERKPADSQHSALADYLDDLLHGEPEFTDFDPDPEPEPEPDLETAQETTEILLAAGPVAADDERHYLFPLLGLTLAIPAHRVCAEQPMPSRLDGDAGSLVCLAALGDDRVLPVLDLARLMLPGDAAELARPLTERAGLLIVLDGGAWALCAEAPGELALLDLDGVQWRGPGSQRTWLAGTLAARRCALLELDAVAAMVE